MKEDRPECVDVQDWRYRVAHVAWARLEGAELVVKCVGEEPHRHKFSGYAAAEKALDDLMPVPDR